MNCAHLTAAINSIYEIFMLDAIKQALNGSVDDTIFMRDNMS